MSDLKNLLRPRPAPSTAGTLAYLFMGPIAWAIQFTLVYAGHTLVCNQWRSADLGHAVVVGASLPLALLLVAFLLRTGAFARALGLTDGMDARATYDRVARVAALLGLVAIVWTGLTAALVDACVQAR